jgi:hypothetical protein
MLFDKNFIKIHYDYAEFCNIRQVEIKVFPLKIFIDTSFSKVYDAPKQVRQFLFYRNLPQVV